MLHDALEISEGLLVIAKLERLEFQVPDSYEAHSITIFSTAESR